MITKNIKLIVVLLLFRMIPSAWAGEIQLPALIPASDRDPEHLAAFTEGLYKWYVSTNVFFIPEPNEKEQAEKEAAFRTLQTLVTPFFYSQKENIRSKLNADPVLLARDTNSSWEEQTTARVTKMHPTIATLEVSLPDKDYKSGKVVLPYLSIAYRLTVTLRAVGGFWRLDTVTMLEPSEVSQYKLLPPPTLIPCKTAVSCNRNPQHLEKFLTDFYRWYIERWDYETEILPLYRTPFETQTQAILNQIIHASLRHYWAWLYAQDPLSLNPILYVQDISSGGIRTNLISFTNDKAVLDVFLDWDGNDITQLRVTLIVDQGAWRIRNIVNMSPH